MWVVQEEHGCAKLWGDEHVVFFEVGPECTRNFVHVVSEDNHE